MDELERSAQLLREALDELRKQGIVTAQTFAKLNQATIANTNAQEDQTDETKKSSKALKGLYQTAKQVAGGFLDTAQQARKNREDFTSLNPAIRATGVAVGKLGASFGNALQSVGQIVSVFGPKGLVAGLVLTGLGKLFATASEELGSAAAKYGEFVTGEIQRVVSSYQTIARVGAIGADGMRGFVDAANRSGLAYEQFAKVIAQNSQSLTLFSGTSLKGRDALVGLSQAAKPFEEEFLALGVGFEEQRDLYAKSMQQSRILGNVQRNDYNALAAAAKNYIYELQELSAITGLQRDQAEALLQQQRADIRFQAVMAQFGKTLDAGGQNMATGFSKIGAILSERTSKEIGMGFQDAISNLGTEAAQSFMLATGSAGKTIIEDYKRGRITQEEALFQIDKAIRANYARLGGVEMQSQLGKLNTRIEKILPGMFNLSTQTGNLADDLKETAKTVKDTGKTQNEETKQIVKAQQNLQNFAQQLDMIVAKKLLPHAAQHIQTFTSVLSTAITKINKELGVNAAQVNRGANPAFGRGGGGGPAFGGARPGGGASQDYLSRIAQLESGGRNIANQARAGQKATSAFGLYQITKETFESLVANAAPGSPLKGKTFEDMKADVNLQTEAMKQLTASNEQLLARRGLSTSDAAKYMAHMMGYGTAAKILEAPGTTPLSRLVPQDYLDKNNLGMFKNAAQLRSHFDRITGGQGYQYCFIASGPRSGYTAMLHCT